MEEIGQNVALNTGGFQEGKPRRDYKDRLFRMIFKEKESLLDLYNAVNGTDYDDPNELEIVTLENAVYMNVKNDLAFVVDFYLNLYEHQSTISKNIPLRNLFYIAKELQTKVDAERLYRKKQVKVPTPKFLVFYNGTEKYPERQILRLSDAFIQPMEKPELELIVTVLNINSGNNRGLMEHCRQLKEYMQYVEKIREYVKELPLEQAVEKAVTECIRGDILKDFLIRNRKEAIAVSIFEYNEERALKYIREEEFERGMDLGRQQGIEQGICETVKILRKFGHGDGEIEKTIMEQYKIPAEKAEEYLHK